MDKKNKELSFLEQAAYGIPLGLDLFVWFIISNLLALTIGFSSLELYSLSLPLFSAVVVLWGGWSVIMVKKMREETAFSRNISMTVCVFMSFVLFASLYGDRFFNHFFPKNSIIVQQLKMLPADEVLKEQNLFIGVVYTSLTLMGLGILIIISANIIKKHFKVAIDWIALISLGCVILSQLLTIGIFGRGIGLGFTLAGYSVH